MILFIFNNIIKLFLIFYIYQIFFIYFFNCCKHYINCNFNNVIMKNNNKNKFINVFLILYKY